MRAAEPSAPRRDLIPFGTAARAWFLISLQTFGGPAGQIAVMQRTLVEEKRWRGQQRLLHALNYCMILPGPEAQQLAVYVGWLLNGTAGGIVAGTLFVLPGALAMVVLSSIYVAWGATAAVTAVFSGLAPAVLAPVAQAVVHVGKRALHRPALVALAITAFVVLTVSPIPFPVVVLTAGGVGWLLGRNAGRGAAGRGASTDSSHDAPPVVADDDLHHERPSGRRVLKILGIGLTAWFTPIVVDVAATGAAAVMIFRLRWSVLRTIGVCAVLGVLAQTPGWVS